MAKKKAAKKSAKKSADKNVAALDAILLNILQKEKREKDKMELWDGIDMDDDVLDGEDTY